MPRRASFPRERRRRTDAGMPALRRLEVGGARGDGVQVAAERIHVALKAAVDDEQADDIRREIHDEDDREDQRVRRPDPEVQREALHPGIELRAIHDSREQQHGDRREYRESEGHKPAYRTAQNRSKFIHSRATMRTASLVLSETPTRNP